MANKIQIKRSINTASPTGLANGELAYSANGGVLFIGHPDGTTGTIAIGGLRNPGTLTANQALIANSTSAIDEVRAGQVNAITTSVVGANVIANTSAYFVGNSSVNTFITQNLLDLGGQINANGGVGTAGQILTSGATGNVYWSTPASGVAGSNSQVQFNANGVLSGDDGFTYDGVSNTLTVSGNVSIGSTLLVGANVDLTTSALLIGNSTVNSTVNSSIVQVSSGSGTANLTPTTLVIGTSTVNSTAFAAGANVYINTTTLFAGNATVNSTQTATEMRVANSSSNVIISAAQVSVGANVFANTTAVDVGNTIITSTNLTLGGQLTANASAGSAGQVLVSGGAGNVYWTNQVVDTNTTYDLLAVANTGANEGRFRLSSSALANDDVIVVGANGVVVSSNSTAIIITGQIDTDTNTTYDLLTVANTTLGHVILDPSTGANDDVRFIGTGGIEISSDAGGNVTVNLDQTLSITDLTLSGNLIVNGTLTTLDVDTLRVEDPLISLARNQTAANTLDIGFYGTYGNATVTSYSGLFRDATDGVFKLFAGATPEPTTTVDTANVNFAYSNLTIHSLIGGAAGSTIDLFAIDGGTF